MKIWKLKRICDSTILGAMSGCIVLAKTEESARNIASNCKRIKNHKEEQDKWLSAKSTSCEEIVSNLQDECMIGSWAYTSEFA